MFRLQPFAQAWIFCQAVRDQIEAAFMLAAIDDPVPFLLRQRVDLGEQSPVQGRGAIGEQVHEHRTASGDFARLIRARAFVALQVE
jgi:hypothetical protein